MKQLLYFLLYTHILPLLAQDYKEYHTKTILAEEFIAQEEFDESIRIYSEIIENYTFVFLRDYKITTQLLVHQGKHEKAFDYLIKAIESGWEWKEIKKLKSLTSLQKNEKWYWVRDHYDNLRLNFISTINVELRKQVHQMFKKDQRMALRVFLRMGSEKYAHKNFGPHSLKQIEELKEILNDHGFPSEQLIGNSYWMSTILSHHNSVSETFVKNDKLYPSLRSKLLAALEKGEVSPYELALIEDWRNAVQSNRTEPGYGFLSTPKKSQLPETNNLRASIGLRSIELRNKLVDMENKTGINLYLPDWVKGKIHIE